MRDVQVEYYVCRWSHGLNTFALAAMLILSVASCNKTVADASGDWRVYALEYGASVFPRNKLVQGGRSNEKQPFSWYAWLLVGHGRRVLVDTGFNNQAIADNLHFTHFVPVSDLLQRINIKPTDITDVVLSHLHWDHAGNIQPYRNAVVFVQHEELDWARNKVSPTMVERGGIRLADIKAIDVVDKRGNLKLLRGDAQLFPGVVAHTGGRHTKKIMWLEVQTQTKKIVLASDNAYLFENITNQIPTGSTAHPNADLAQIKAMRRVASDPSWVIPGHDLLPLSRFKRITSRVIQISQ